MKEFHINDGEESPFKVTIDENNKVGIYKYLIDDQPSDDNEKILPYYSDVNIADFEQNPIKVFVSADHPCDTNPVLLEFPNNTYVFILDKVYRFTTDSKITNYYTDDFDRSPSPYVVDEQGKVYLLREAVVIKKFDPDRDKVHYYRKRGLNSEDHGYYDNPYQYYYENKSVGETFEMKVLYD